MPGLGPTIERYYPVPLDNYKPEQIAEREAQVLAALKFQHKTLEEFQRKLGTFRATAELLNRMTKQKKIIFEDGKYKLPQPIKRKGGTADIKLLPGVK